jgi:hypothetical protein
MKKELFVKLVIYKDDLKPSRQINSVKAPANSRFRWFTYCMVKDNLSACVSKEENHVCIMEQKFVG